MYVPSSSGCCKIDASPVAFYWSFNQVHSSLNTLQSSGAVVSVVSDTYCSLLQRLHNGLNSSTSWQVFFRERFDRGPAPVVPNLANRPSSILPAAAHVQILADAAV